MLRLRRHAAGGTSARECDALAPVLPALLLDLRHPDVADPASVSHATVALHSL
jgi:hypothetical protein